MKRMIRSDITLNKNKRTALTKENVTSILELNDIDSTSHTYQIEEEDSKLDAILFDKFICPGDYIALLALKFGRPTPSELTRNEFYLEDLQELIEICPDVDSLRQYAKDNSWSHNPTIVKQLDDDYYVYKDEFEKEYI